MSLLCNICADTLKDVDFACSTICGHLFHYECIIGWMECSKTCPHCRQAITEATIKKVYLNFNLHDSLIDIDDDEDNEHLQLKCVKSESIINHLNDDLKKMQITNTECAKNLRIVERELRGKMKAHFELKNELYMNKLERKKLEGKCKILNKELHELKMRAESRFKTNYLAKRFK